MTSRWARSMAVAAAFVLAVGATACRGQRSEPDADAGLSPATSDATASAPAAPGVDPRCDDTVPEPNVSDAEREDLGLAVAGPVYGSGDVWVILPGVARWSDVVSPAEAPGEFSGKFPIHVTGVDEPSISAALEPEGSPVVDGTVSPTTLGLPGAVPVGVVFPQAGCWSVTVEGTEGTVSFLVDVG